MCTFTNSLRRIEKESSVNAHCQWIEKPRVNKWNNSVLWDFSQRLKRVPPFVISLKYNFKEGEDGGVVEEEDEAKIKRSAIQLTIFSRVSQLTMDTSGEILGLTPSGKPKNSLIWCSLDTDNIGFSLSTTILGQNR